MRSPVATMRAVALFLSLFPGCGGDGGGPGGDCGKIQPCGGDIAGEWTVVNSCVNPAVVMTRFGAAVTDLCAAAKVTKTEVNTTGAYSFTDGMTFTVDESATGSLTVNVPMSCLSGLSCGFLTAAIQLRLSQSPIPDVQSVMCAGTTTCDCTVALRPSGSTESGTYTVAGSLLTTRDISGGMRTREYCVRGSTLHFLNVDRAMTTAGQPTINTDVVAAKK